MDLKTIKDALHRQPFAPFTISLADGRKLAVRHPDFVAVGTRIIVVIGAEDDSTYFVEPLLVVSIDYPSTAVAASGTG